METSPRAALTERTAAKLLERALGAPWALVVYDAQGRPQRMFGAETAPTLTAEQREALVEGRAVELEAEGTGLCAVGALDEGGLLWIALRPADDLRALPRFTHHLVHQLRNALSSLKLAAQALAKAAGLSERERRRTDISLREVARMERVLSTATEFVVGAPARLGPMPLTEVVKAAANALAPELAARGLSLDLVLDETPPKLDGDLTRLELAIQNLLAHAARVLADGGALVLTLDQEQGVARVRLESDGAGAGQTPVNTAARLELALPAQVAKELGGALEVYDAGPGLRLALWLAPRKVEGERGHAALGG